MMSSLYLMTSRFQGKYDFILFLRCLLPFRITEYVLESTASSFIPRIPRQYSWDYRQLCLPRASAEKFPAGGGNGKK